MSVPVGVQGLISGSPPEAPLYFLSGDSTLFGWLYRQPALSADVGLVICRPFGFESVCSHRSLRAFAAAAASIGVPAMLFDYAGTGDSQDSSSDTDQLVKWTADVVAAVSELQRCTGVRHVCLLGIRLGALLATLAAMRCEAVCGLIVIAPIIKGPRYLRELRLVQMAAARVPVVAPDQNTHEMKVGGVKGIEVSGFSLTRETTRALLATDLMNLESAPAARVLVIDRTDLPAARSWANTLGRLGAQTEYLQLTGLVEMVWTVPHLTSIPWRMVTAMTDWLAVLKAEATCKTAPDGGPVDDERAAILPSVMVFADDPLLPQKALTERAVFFASEPSLFGIVTEPSKGETRRRGVILVNDGATHHIGANRIYVTMARRWARCGYTVLRMDLAGLGDSATRPGRHENEVFPPAALDDVRAAIDYLQDRYGARDITIGGLCAGAYHALRSAVAALPVDRVLMVNPLNFFWKEGMRLTDLQLAEVVRNPAVYRTRILSVDSWKRVLTGKVNIWRIASVHILRGMLSLESSVRSLARRLRIPLPRDLGRELEGIAARGVQTVFVFSSGEPGIELLHLLAGSTVTRLGERCRIHVIRDADHIFSQSASRRALENILSEELFVLPTSESPSVDLLPKRMER
jgi:alpha-beta hydrolase superfamily lysophospholipase